MIVAAALSARKEATPGYQPVFTAVAVVYQAIDNYMAEHTARCMLMDRFPEKDGWMRQQFKLTVIPIEWLMLAIVKDATTTAIYPVEP